MIIIMIIIVVVVIINVIISIEHSKTLLDASGVGK